MVKVFAGGRTCRKAKSIRSDSPPFEYSIKSRVHSNVRGLNIREL